MRARNNMKVAETTAIDRFSGMHKAPWLMFAPTHHQQLCSPSPCMRPPHKYTNCMSILLCANIKDNSSSFARWAPLLSRAVQITSFGKIFATFLICWQLSSRGLFWEVIQSTFQTCLGCMFLILHCMFIILRFSQMLYNRDACICPAAYFKDPVKQELS